MYLKTGNAVAKRALAKMKGSAVTHFASRRCLAIIEDIMSTGTVGLGVSSLEELSALKKKCARRIGPLGNLNGIEMPH